jgi:hypothetical protein
MFHSWLREQVSPRLSTEKISKIAEFYRSTITRLIKATLPQCLIFEDGGAVERTSSTVLDKAQTHVGETQRLPKRKK